MKLTILAALLVSSGAYAQSAKNPNGTAAEQEARLVQIEREIGKANFDCDYKYFALVEAAEFVFTDAGGGFTTRAQDLAGEKDCKRSSGKYELDDVRVTLYGQTAVLTALATTTTTNASGEPNVRRNRFTDVFVWRAGRWQLVAGHSSRVPPPKKP